jgi:hypothetical protein
MTPPTVNTANPIDERPIESVGHPWGLQPARALGMRD